MGGVVAKGDIVVGGAVADGAVVAVDLPLAGGEVEMVNVTGAVEDVEVAPLAAEVERFEHTDIVDD